MEGAIVDRRTDARLREGSNHLIARGTGVFVDANREQMPRMQAAFRRRSGQIERQAAQQFEIQKRRFLPLILKEMSLR